MSPILTQLGLTPEMIARHVVAVDRSAEGASYAALKGWREKQNHLRSARRSQGLNVLTGQPLQRSPNGRRKPRKPRFGKFARV